MDFKETSDTLLGVFNLEQQAAHFGCSHQHFRRMRSQGKVSSRRAPADWHERMRPMVDCLRERIATFYHANGQGA
jgi:hypothetical protein